MSKKTSFFLIAGMLAIFMLGRLSVKPKLIPSKPQIIRERVYNFDEWGVDTDIFTLARNILGLSAEKVKEGQDKVRHWESGYQQGWSEGFKKGLEKNMMSLFQ